MKTTLLFLPLYLWVTIFTYAQTGKELKATKLYQRFDYTRAITGFTKSKSLTTSSQRALADAYYRTGAYDQSAQQYKKIIADTGAIASDYLALIQLYKMANQYDSAHLWMDNYMAAYSTTPQTNKSYTENSDNLSTLLNGTGFFSLDNLSMNNAEQDFEAGFINDSTVVFSSTREGITPVKKVYNWNGQSFLDLYTATFSNKQLTSIEPFDAAKMNKGMHEGSVSVAKQGTLMAFTKNNYQEKSTDNTVNLEIYFREWIDGKWTNEKAFPFNSKDYSVGHPTLSEDGNTLYFVSNMPGGIGETDIYQSTKTADGAWSTPVNMGTPVNTELKEMFPFLDEQNQLLFFASEGHYGLGGLDVFAYPLGSTSVADVVNVGAPVNSNRDDFALTLDKTSSFGFVTSNRTTGQGDDDIYYIEFLKPIAVKKKIQGTSKEISGAIVPGTKVYLLEAGKVVDSATTGTDGQYVFLVDKDKNFTLSGNKTSYFEGKNTASSATDKEIVWADVVLTKDPGLALIGEVTDKSTKTPLDQVHVVLTNKKTGEKLAFVTAADGLFTHPLIKNKVTDTVQYNLFLSREGYLSKSVNYTRILDKEGIYYVHTDMDLSMDPIGVGTDLAKIIQINPIYFDLNKYVIRPDAAKELDKIVKVMNENPTMVIELGSHTDCRGSMTSNATLSDNRAKASAEYIKKRITNPERIYGKGYGETKLKIDCPCEGTVNSTCTEDEHQQNRRTEFVIIKL